MFGIVKIKASDSAVNAVNYVDERSKDGKGWSLGNSSDLLAHVERQPRREFTHRNKVGKVMANRECYHIKFSYDKSAENDVKGYAERVLDYWNELGHKVYIKQHINAKNPHFHVVISACDLNMKKLDMNSVKMNQIFNDMRACIEADPITLEQRLKSVRKCKGEGRNPVMDWRQELKKLLDNNLRNTETYDEYKSACAVEGIEIVTRGKTVTYHWQGNKARLKTLGNQYSKEGVEYEQNIRRLEKRKGKTYDAAARNEYAAEVTKNFDLVSSRRSGSANIVINIRDNKQQAIDRDGPGDFTMRPESQKQVNDAARFFDDKCELGIHRKNEKSGKDFVQPMSWNSKNLKYASFANLNGGNIYMRPVERDKYIMVDDVKPAGLDDHKGKKGRLIVESSPANYNVWVKLKQATEPEIRRFLQGFYGTDEKANSEMRWGRCPGFTNRNTKPDGSYKHQRPDGSFPFAKVAYMQPEPADDDVIYSKIAEFVAQIASEKQKEQERKEQVALATIEMKKKQQQNNYVFEKVGIKISDDYATIARNKYAEYLEKNGNNRHNADVSLALYFMHSKLNDEQIRALIAINSEKASEQKDADNYLDSVMRKASIYYNSDTLPGGGGDIITSFNMGDDDLSGPGGRG